MLRKERKRKKLDTENEANYQEIRGAANADARPAHIQIEVIHPASLTGISELQTPSHLPLAT